MPSSAEYWHIEETTIRFSSTAVPEAEAIQRFIPRLRVTAQRIGEDFLSQGEQQALSIATDNPAPASDH